MIDPRILLKFRHKLKEELIVLSFHPPTQIFNFITDLKEADVINVEKLKMGKRYTKSKEHLKEGDTSLVNYRFASVFRRCILV